jgi:hypothetical protein
MHLWIIKEKWKKNLCLEPGMVPHACYPSTWEAEARWSWFQGLPELCGKFQARLETWYKETLTPKTKEEFMYGMKIWNLLWFCINPGKRISDFLLRIRATSNLLDVFAALETGYGIYFFRQKVRGKDERTEERKRKEY